MKWCFLLNQAPLMIEFLGKLSHQVIEEGDECIVLANSKIAELSKRQYFPKDIKIFSKVDWLKENYKKDLKEFRDISWKELFSTFDRKFKFFKFNYQNSVEIVSQLYQFFDFVFQKEKPDVVIQEPPANLFTSIAYSLCKKYNIIYLGLISSRFEGRIDLYDLEFSCSKYRETFEAISNYNISDNEKKFAKNFIKKFIPHLQLPSYMKYQIIHSNEIYHLKRYLRGEKKMWRPWLQYFLKRRYLRPFDYESEALLRWSFWRPWLALKRRFMRILFSKSFAHLNNNDKFFLFPIHVQPEASTSVQATYFYDQLNTAKNIAFSLPFPYKLYVKEHPAAVGERLTNFYKELKKIPNIVLISPHENVENLIRKSQGVITLTSTIGLEAVLVGKPVYVLGNVFYSHHPLCKKVNSFEELKEKIQTDLIKEPTAPNLEGINVRFIISYLRNTIAGEIGAAGSKQDTNNYKAIYKGIKQMFLE